MELQKVIYQYEADRNAYEATFQGLRDRCDSESVLREAQARQFNELKQELEAETRREHHSLHQRLAQLEAACRKAEDLASHHEDLSNKGEQKLVQLTNQIQALQQEKGKLDSRLQVAQAEVKDFKRRCKELEDNLDQSRIPSENSGYFANRGSDYGVKDLSIQFQKEQKRLQQQLASAKEERKEALK